MIEEVGAIVKASGGFVGMTGLGACRPPEVLYLHLGFTPEAIVAEARRLLATPPEAATA
jgi:transketolase